MKFIENDSPLKKKYKRNILPFDIKWRGIENR